jgi:glycosyltransferase involved in cell wall biosynthesis
MIERVSIPISTAEHRLNSGFLDFCLASLFRNSQRNHEILLVTETPGSVSRYVHDRWSRRGQHSIRIIEDQPKQRSFGVIGDLKENPLYQFLNTGVRSAEERWVLTPAGDDSYFPPEWERLLDAVDPARAERAVWTPRYLSVPTWDGPPGGTTQVSTHERALHPEEGEPYVMEAAVIRAVKEWSTGETIQEICGDRRMVAWPHTVVHRDLFERVGGYEEDPPYPNSCDLHFGDALRDRFAVIAVGVHSACIVNARIPVKLDY